MHLCSKENLEDNDFNRIGELAQDPQVNLNYRSEDQAGGTPLILLCSSNKNQLLECVETLLKREGTDVNLTDDQGSSALIQLCQHYQGNDLIDVIRLLIRHGIYVDSRALLNLCQFHEGKSLKEALRTFLDCDPQMLWSKNDKDDTVFTVLFGRTKKQNSRINLVKIVRFLMKRGLELDPLRFHQLVNSRNRQGRNALHVLSTGECSEHFIPLIQQLRNGKIDITGVDREGQNTIHLILSSHHYNQGDNLMQLITYLLNDCGISAKSKDKKGKDAFDILFDCCNQRQDLIDIFRLLVGPFVYPNPSVDDACRALLDLFSSADMNLIKRFASRLIKSGKMDVLAVTDTYRNTTALHLLCRNYRDDDLIDLVRLLIIHGADAKAIDRSGVNSLHLLCGNYNGPNLKEIVELLIDAGTDVGLNDELGSNALHYLCQNSSSFTENSLLPVVRLLIDKGIDVRKLEKTQHHNALHLLCINYQRVDLLEVIKLFIAKIDLNVNDKIGRNVFHLLCLRQEQGHDLLEIVSLLIQNGIVINAQDYLTKSNVLHLLCQHYHRSDLKEIIQLLIDNHISINATNNWPKSNALHILCENYQGEQFLEILHIFIQAKIDLTATDKHQRNALHLLCANYKGDNLFPIVSELLKAIDVKAVTCREGDDGCNALPLLCRNYRGRDLKDIVQLFINKGIDVDSTDVRSKRNALHYLCRRKAAEDDSIDIVRLLIEKGIDVNQLDSDGSNALHLICRSNHGPGLIDIIRLLIEKKINVKLTDQKDRGNSAGNALDLLCQYYEGDSDLLPIVRLLVEESPDGIEVGNKFYGDRSNPLYLLLANYKGADFLDLVSYLVIDNKIEVDVLKALEILEKRQDSDLPNKEAIRQIFLTL